MPGLEPFCVSSLWSGHCTEGGEQGTLGQACSLSLGRAGGTVGGIVGGITESACRPGAPAAASVGATTPHSAEHLGT